MATYSFACFIAITRATANNSSLTHACGEGKMKPGKEKKGSFMKQLSNHRFIALMAMVGYRARAVALCALLMQLCAQLAPSLQAADVTIVATDAHAEERGATDTGTFTVSRTGSTASSLVVN